MAGLTRYGQQCTPAAHRLMKQATVSHAYRPPVVIISTDSIRLGSSSPRPDTLIRFETLLGARHYLDVRHCLIRSSSGILKLRNFMFFSPDRMDNL